MKTLIFLLTIIAATTLVRADEIVPMWQTEWDINPDIIHQETIGQNFLKGHDQFLFIGTDIGICTLQIRETTTGKVIKSEITNNVYVENDFEILPDSTSFIMSVGGLREGPTGFEVRSLEDFSIISQFEVPIEGDTITEYWNKYVNRVLDVKVDPNRPYVYFILEKALPVQSVDEEIEYYAIKVYNYETGEEVRELRTYKNDYLEFIDISHDGKYLASINEGESFLNVWELESFSLIKSYKLDRSDLDNSWRENVRDMKFSRLSSDKIYFSGSFFKIGYPEEFDTGVFEYSIERGNHIKLLPKNNYTGKLIFTKNEKTLFLNSSFTLLFFDFISEKLEFMSSQPVNFLIGTNAIYSSNFNAFITSTSHQLNSFKFINQTPVKNSVNREVILYPNPTTDKVTIETICNNSEVQIEIIDINGSIIKTDFIPISNGNISISLLDLPIGTYFLKIGCGSKTYIYNVVKEG